MISKIKNGLMFFIDTWKKIDYKKAIIWGGLSSIYTGILLLSINYLSEKIPDPLVGYILKSVLSILIIIPIFLIAYIIVDKKNIHYFKNNLFIFYIWLLPSLVISCLAGILMIFIGNIYIFYFLFFLNAVYLIATIFSPYLLFKNKDLKESMIMSIKKVYNNLNILFFIILNIIIVLLIFKGLGYITNIIAEDNINIALILSIIISLCKPLLYALPLFNILVITKEIKDNEENIGIKKDEVGDVI